MGFLPAPTEGILCVWSLQKDGSGEYLGMDISFRKRLFYGNFLNIRHDHLKIMSAIHSMMYIKKEKLNCSTYINCFDTIKVFDKREFSNIISKEEKVGRALRWIVFEKRLPNIFLWNEDMWGSQYEILK